jgi:MoaA/NifB/PqqE/SkfB family radical SAM enzyme
MKYQIEADWHLLNTCNYRCKYCFSTPESLGEKLRAQAGAGEWRAAFDATGLVWLLHMTGGEPSIYPNFAEFCARLTERHYISINSNLTNPSLMDFAQRIDPARVSFINAGLHLIEREQRSDTAIFLRHAELLRSKGFTVFASLVATPAALARFADAVALLRPIGIYPIPKLLRGPFEGRIYPNAYSDLDRIRFRLRAAEARREYQAMLARMSEPPSIDMFGDDEFLESERSFAGIPCEAGVRFVKLYENGDVTRCSSKTKLGNLLQGTFRPRAEAAPCDTAHCFYFCRKYAAWTPPAPGAEVPA